MAGTGTVIYLAPSQELTIEELASEMSETEGEPAFTLQFPLKCADPDCSVTYDDGPYQRGMMTSLMDHAMKISSVGTWHYGNVYNKGGDGVIVAFDGSRVEDPSPDTNDPVCLRGTISLGGLMTPGGCLAGFTSYDEHPGYDYRVAIGTEVYPAAAGTVVETANGLCELGNMGYSCDYWGAMGIDHGNGIITQYAHLSEVKVSAGQEVALGDVIGLTGDKGTPGNPHLHFEVLVRTDDGLLAIDPYGWSGEGEDPLYSADVWPGRNLWAAPGAAEPETEPQEFNTEAYGDVELTSHAFSSEAVELRNIGSVNADYQCTDWVTSRNIVVSATVSARSVLTLKVRDKDWGDTVFSELWLDDMPQESRSALLEMLASGEVIEVVSRGCGSGLIPELGSVRRITASTDIDAIPVLFLGMWDVPLGPCEEYSDTVLYIRPLDLFGHSNYGAVTEVKADGDGILVTLQFDGEGQKWDEVRRLSLDGSRLKTELRASSDRSAPYYSEYKAAVETALERCRLAATDGEQIASSILGSWADGGPGCLAIDRASYARSVEVRAFYCESGASSVSPIMMDYDDTVSAFVDEVTGLELRVQSGSQLELIASEEIRARLGESAYLPENRRAYFAN